MERPKIELGIIIAGLRRLLVAIGHVLVGHGGGESGGDLGQHGEAASNYDSCLLEGLRDRATWDRVHRLEIWESHCLYTLSALFVRARKEPPHHTSR